MSRRQNPLLASGDILILAGQICYLDDDNYSKQPFWDWASESYRQVIVVPGNHELYKSYDINNLHNAWKEHIRENASCYYNCVVQIENVDIIACGKTTSSTLPYSPYQEILQTPRKQLEVVYGQHSVRILPSGKRTSIR